MGIRLDFSKVYSMLSELDKRAQSELLKMASDEASKPLLETMINNSPYKTGELRESLGVSKKNDGNGVYRIKVGVGYAANTPIAKIKKLNDKAFYTNYGTRKMNGTRWMDRSVEEAKDKCLEKVAEVIKESLGDL